MFSAGWSLSTALPARSKGEINVWTARALATVLAEVGSEFERTSGYNLRITSDLPAGFRRRASAGEPFDLLISTTTTIDQWVSDGRVIPESRPVVARSGIGVAVRAGARKPDLSSIDAFKRALLDAKSIAYLRVGSGLHMTDVIERLGIATAITPKLIRPETDIVAELVAKGEVELGVVVITQILTTPGVELAGPLPPALRHDISFAAGVSSGSTVRAAATELIGLVSIALMTACGDATEPDEPNVGVIRVITLTAGQDLDSDGYYITVDSDPKRIGS